MLHQCDSIFFWNIISSLFFFFFPEIVFSWQFVSYILICHDDILLFTATAITLPEQYLDHPQISRLLLFCLIKGRYCRSAATTDMILMLLIICILYPHNCVNNVLLETELKVLLRQYMAVVKSQCNINMLHKFFPRLFTIHLNEASAYKHNSHNMREKCLILSYNNFIRWSTLMVRLLNRTEYSVACRIVKATYLHNPTSSLRNQNWPPEDL